MAQFGRSFLPLIMGAAVASAQARDTVRIRADGPPAWGTQARIVEEFSIGQVDGAPEYAFGRLTHIAVAPDLSFYAYDANDKQIRRYDSKGRFLNLIGRSGGGPGEYQMVAGLAVTRDSLLLVDDQSNRRYTYFQPDGKVRTAFRPSRGGFYGSGFVIDNAERIYVPTSVGARLTEGPGSHQQFLRFRGEQLVDSIALPVQPSVPRSFYIMTSDGGRWNFTERHIAMQYSGGGALLARAGAYRIVVDTGAGTVRVIERRTAPVAVSPDEHANWVAWAEFFGKRPGAPVYEVPRLKPFIRELKSDNLGRIWVDVFTRAEKRENLPVKPPERGPQLHWRERSTFDVFSPAGEYLGRVVMPPEGELIAIRGNRLWVRTKGTVGEDRITVFRIETAAR